MARPYRIAFVTAHMGDLFSRSMWYALQDCARVHGIRLTALLAETLDYPEGGGRVRDIHHLLTPTNFDGALLFTGLLGEFSRPETIEGYLKSLAPLPIVSLGVPMEGASSVAIDQKQGIETLVQHLYNDHGHRRFAYVEGRSFQIEADQRKRGFLAAMASLGVPEDHFVLLPGDYSRASGAAAVASMMGFVDRPTALVCSNDAEAFGAIGEAVRRGLVVPGDLAVTGFDDVDLASLQEPRLTTVRQPIIQQTVRGVELLLKLIAGAPPGEHWLEPGQLVVRRSCGCQVQRRAEVVVPRNSAEFIEGLLGYPGNASVGFLSFVQTWVLDYVLAFEHALETGDQSRLRSQWLRYMEFQGLELERGLSFRKLFAGLEAWFGERPGFEAAYRENLFWAGEAESRKGVNSEQRTRELFYRLHVLETALAQVTTLEELASMADPGWSELGIVAVTLFGVGFTPSVVSVAGPTLSDWSGGYGLPPEGALDSPGVHRVVVSLELEKTYLGYLVFWGSYSKVSIYELLGNQFALAVHRIELLSRLEVQRRTLERSLDDARRMQRQLVETEKVASLGRLVAGVAHEINTPLGTGITGSSFLLERLEEVRSQLTSGSLSRSHLDEFLALGSEALEGILRNLMKAGELIQVFKGLGLDHGRGEWKPVDLDDLFSDLGSVYQAAMANRGIGFRLEIARDLKLFYTQASALVQIAGELLENALEHAFDTDVPRDPLIVLQVGVDKDHLRLAVIDNGRGISEDDRRHLFDPLFTTKRAKGHPGLGLHLAFQLVVQTLGGQMTVASVPGEGSCFLCLIPMKNSE